MKRQLRMGLVFSVLVLVSLALGALTPGVVYAEGEVPEAPPVEEPPLEEPGTEEAASAVEALAESGTVIVQDGATLPLASQAALDAVCEPDPWFYCTKPGALCVAARAIISLILFQRLLTGCPWAGTDICTCMAARLMLV